MPAAAILIYTVFLAQVLSLIVYLKLPWIAVIVAWIDVVLILSAIFPWHEHSLQSFIHQFGLDLTFFVTAHIGFIASHFQQSKKNQARTKETTARG
jgi:hypothetical protein